MGERVYIALGSNLGDRQANVRQAIRLAESSGAISAVRASSLYESEPWGVAGQPRFINAVVEARTSLKPRQLLERLKSVEAAMGRGEAERWGPRLIDLDIIFYGAMIIKERGLEVPHPGAHVRPFVMTPLAEIAPDLVHPTLGLTAFEIAARLGGEGLRRLEG